MADTRENQVLRRRFREVELLFKYGRLDLRIMRDDPQLGSVKSDATFWQDFGALADLGIGERTVGGLEMTRRQVFEGTYFGRNYADGKHQRDREAIAKHVAQKLVQDYETGVVGHGATALAATHAILQMRMGVTIITTNIAVAELVRQESAVIIGGLFERDIWALCGADAERRLGEELARRQPHFGIVGASGVSLGPEPGEIALYCHKPVEAGILSIICERSPRLIIVVGREKLRKHDMMEFWRMRQGTRTLDTILVTTRAKESEDAERARLVGELEDAFRAFGERFRVEEAAWNDGRSGV